MIRPEDFWAVRGVSLEIPKGSVYGLIGHNGSGKSTLLGCLAGINQPSCGVATVQGTTPTALVDQLLPQKLAAALAKEVKASNHGFQIYLFKTYGDLLRFKKEVGSEPEWAINHIPESG